MPIHQNETLRKKNVVRFFFTRTTDGPVRRPAMECMRKSDYEVSISRPSPLASLSLSQAEKHTRDWILENDDELISSVKGCASPGSEPNLFFQQ